MQHFQKWKFLTFYIFVGTFCPPGSGSAFWMRIRIQQLKLMRIRIHNPESNLCCDTQRRMRLWNMGGGWPKARLRSKEMRF
jgi:hypothetical protein